MGPPRLQLRGVPFVLPPPALVLKELPTEMVGNHGNHPLPSESGLEKKAGKGWEKDRKRAGKGQEKGREKAGIGQDEPPGLLLSPEIPRARLDLRKKTCAGSTLNANSKRPPFPYTSSPDSQSWEFQEKPLRGI